MALEALFNSEFLAAELDGFEAKGRHWGSGVMNMSLEMVLPLVEFHWQAYSCQTGTTICKYTKMETVTVFVLRDCSVNVTDLLCCLPVAGLRSALSSDGRNGKESWGRDTQLHCGGGIA